MPLPGERELLEPHAEKQRSGRGTAVVVKAHSQILPERDKILRPSTFNNSNDFQLPSSRVRRRERETAKIIWR